jgi:response regulator RpfG family c-di-GMP phosphodiesterase
LWPATLASWLALTQLNRYRHSALSIAIAGVFDTLISAPPCKPAWPLDKVINLIRSAAGKHFDPHLTELFIAQ